jgi:hypothetical protein
MASAAVLLQDGLHVVEITRLGGAEERTGGKKDGGNFNAHDGNGTPAELRLQKS